MYLGSLNMLNLAFFFNALFDKSAPSPQAIDWSKPSNWINKDLRMPHIDSMAPALLVFLYRSKYRFRALMMTASF